MPIFGCLFLMVAAAVAPRPAELVLERALPVDGLPNAEPSGLTLCGGVLYTVSDNHDQFIYRVKVEAERAVLEPAIPVSIPLGARGDFEGIVCDEAGAFYIACEAQFRVLYVAPDGKRCAWETPNLKAIGEAGGLFKFRGGYFEGIERIDAKHFVLCAERQPRGLVYVDTSAVYPKTEIYELNEPTVQPRGLRFPDFTDLCRHNQRLFVLERNAEIISTLERTEGAPRVVAWRSFRETIERDAYRYADARFGTAEGLAMDAEHVYIILDNNGSAKAADAADHRPMLFIFAMPKTE